MLPFTVEEFFDVFAAYNAAIWPAQTIAYLFGGVTVWAVMTGQPWGSRLAAGVLGLFWLWNGLAYHLVFFTPINRAAYVFAALFLTQGLLFFAYGALADRLGLTARTDRRGALALALIAYAAVIYEALGYAQGHGWPRAPMFGVAPCPTTIFTFGLLLLAAGPVPLWLITIPVIWAGIGSTAAILLAVPEDLGLLVSGALAAGLLSPWSSRQSPPTA